MSACNPATFETVSTGLEPALDSGAVMPPDGVDMPVARPGAPTGLTEAATLSEATVGTGATVAFSGATPTTPVPLMDGSVVAAGSAPMAETAALAAGASPPPSPTGEAIAPAPAGDPATRRIRAAENAPTGARPAQTAGAGATVTRTDDRAASRPRFLNALFGNRRDEEGRPRPLVGTASAAARPVIAEQAAQPRPVIATASMRGNATGLPGFDRARAFGIDMKGGGEIDASVQLASAAGLARLAPNGLRTQHSGVDVACLKPALVRLLKHVEQRYGKPVIVTSGYRSPTRNSAARGAKNSLHIYCAAADIQVPGVSKWDLAAYLRSMPGRGGVGTYCHTNSVHVDIGPRRDWNWRCRRRG